MKNKILGYVILSRDGDGFHSAPDRDDDLPTLWFGSHLSLFATRREAQRHLDRTRKFMTKKNYDWPWIDTAVIRSVKAALCES